MVWFDQESRPRRSGRLGETHDDVTFDQECQTSREIIAGDLSRRVPVRNANDEFDHLAGSLNAMLDRIESLMTGLREVSTDIAHDLRTPLSRLRQRQAEAS